MIPLHNSTSDRSSLRLLGILQALAQLLFLKATEAGDIYLDTYEGWYANPPYDSSIRIQSNPSCTFTFFTTATSYRYNVREETFVTENGNPHPQP
jgi:hypothetical protein